MNLSIIIPLLNESDSISLLADEICTVLSKTDYKYEVIFIDDGSSDLSWSIINSLTSNPVFKGIRFKKNLGKSTALDVGFLHAQGNVVCKELKQIHMTVVVQKWKNNHFYTDVCFNLAGSI